MVGAAVGGAPRLLVLALSEELAVVLAVTFASGIGIAAVNPLLGVAIYERVPAGLQTRVIGLAGSLAFAGLPLGALLGGWSVTALGLVPALLAMAAFCLVVTLLPLLPGFRPRPAPAPAERAPDAVGRAYRPGRTAGVGSAGAAQVRPGAGTTCSRRQLPGQRTGAAPARQAWRRQPDSATASHRRVERPARPPPRSGEKPWDPSAQPRASATVPTCHRR